jgi:hypothetical protein
MAMEGSKADGGRVRLAHDRIYNFGAGPGALPLQVLEETQRTLLNFHGSGMSVMEVSHRSKQYEEVHFKAERDFRQLLYVAAVRGEACGRRCEPVPSRGGLCSVGL